MDEIDLEHERRLTEVEQRSKSNTKRLDDLEDRTEDIHRLATTMEVMALRQETMGKTVTNMGETVSSIQTQMTDIRMKPARNLESIAKEIMKLLVAAIFGMVLAQLGIN